MRRCSEDITYLLTNTMYYFKLSDSIRSFGVPSLVLALCGCLIVLTNAKWTNPDMSTKRDPLLPLGANFIRKLLVPCEIPELVPIRSLPQEELDSALEKVVIDILRKTLALQDIVKTMIGMKELKECANLRLQLPLEPVHADLRHKPLNETLQLFFATQLTYTIQAYQMMEQTENTAFLSCPEDGTFRHPAEMLFDHMRDILCSMMITINLTEGINYTFLQDITHHAERRLYLMMGLCDYKYYMNCYFLRSTSVLLRDIKNYFWNLAFVLLPTLDGELNINYISTSDTAVEVDKTSSVRFPGQLPESVEDAFTVTEDTWNDKDFTSSETPVEVGKNIRSILMKRKPKSDEPACPSDYSTN